MHPLRLVLVALLTASTLLFALGVALDRGGGDVTAHSQALDAEGEPGHDEAAEQREAGEPQRGERVLGVDPESTPLIVLAVLAGLALAALVASRFGTRPGILLVVAIVALVWAVLDAREFAHQLDESRAGIAAIALIVAVLHLGAAAASGRLMRARGRAAV
jgi:hypothetical protein